MTPTPAHAPRQQIITLWRLEAFPTKKLRTWALLSVFGLFQTKKIAIEAGKFGVKKGVLFKPRVEPIKVFVSFSHKTGLKDLGWEP